MVLRMVRFFLGSQREGLAQQRQAHQQENQQRFRGEPAVANHTDTIVARAYGFRLAELGWRDTRVRVLEAPCYNLARCGEAGTLRFG
jgi:hypothetical protein